MQHVEKSPIEDHSGNEHGLADAWAFAYGLLDGAGNMN